MRRASCITGIVVPALMSVLASCNSSVCHTDELSCDGACIAPATDGDNCGACGNVCATGTTCEAGACTATPATCASPQLQCGSACIDPMTTADHCGDCTTVCDADADCIAGTCDGPLALLQTTLSTTPAARDAFVLQATTLALTKLDASTLASDRVIDAAVLPNGGILLVAAEGAEDVFELFLASPRGGALTKLSPPLPAGASVRPGIVVSRDGSTVLYRSDQDTEGVIELYAISVATQGASVKVNGALAEGGAVSRVFALSGDGKRAAYVADQDTEGLEEAYTVDLSTATPGASVKISGTVTESVFDLELSDDGTKIVFRAPNPTTSVVQISEVDVATPAVQNPIVTTDGSAGFVTDYALTSDNAVVFTGSTEQLQQQLWRAPLTAPFTSVLIVPSTNGFVREFVPSIDGSQVFYRDQGQHLLEVPIAAPNTPIQLSLDTDSSVDLTTDFALAANGKAIAFRAGADGAEGGFEPTPGTTEPTDPGIVTSLLYVVDLTATPGSSSGSAVELAPMVAAGHAGVSDGYIVLPDERVIYRADQDTIGVTDAYLAGAATAPATTKVSPALGAGSDSDGVSRLLAFP